MLRGVWKYLFLLLIFASVVLTGCKSNDQKAAEGINDPGKNGRPIRHTDYTPQPIVSGNLKIDKIAGWITDEEILFTARSGSLYTVKKYNIKTGYQTDVFESNFPIISVFISTDKKRITIHSSPSDKKAILDVITKDGEKLYSLSLPSSEISVEWNPYETQEFLVTAFAEDWSYTCYIVDSSLKTVNDLDVDQPFLQWRSKNNFVFLDWNKNKGESTAPLVMESTEEKKKEKLKEDIIDFITDKHVLVTLEEGKSDEGKFSFYIEKLKSLQSFHTPLVKSLSGWVLPNTDLNAEQNLFVAFLPGNQADSENYQLIVYNWMTGQKKRILDRHLNEPLQLSPDGKKCLIGGRFENVIDIKTKKIYNLIR